MLARCVRGEDVAAMIRQNQRCPAGCGYCCCYRRLEKTEQKAVQGAGDATTESDEQAASAIRVLLTRDRGNEIEESNLLYLLSKKSKECEWKKECGFCKRVKLSTHSCARMVVGFRTSSRSRAELQQRNPATIPRSSTPTSFGRCGQSDAVRRARAES